jgi:hypothetical protein
MTTTEGRPFITSDKTYAEQRKCRLQDAVDDYLQDEDVSILEFYTELKDCIEDIITYHKKNKERAMGMLQLVLGHRPIDGLDDGIDQVEVTAALNKGTNIPERF